jgi:flagellum-specific peptidoglycan hydrolase FlgJ
MPNTTQRAWLMTMVPAAELSMQQWRIPASVTLAQCILESSWGQSDLAKDCKNFFGVKAQQGQAYEAFPTAEYEHGQRVIEAADFAKYPSAEESFYAHAQLLATLPRYKPAMKDVGNYVDFCMELQVCGYSTSPTYAASLLELIRELNLTQYDAPAYPAEPAKA